MSIVEELDLGAERHARSVYRGFVEDLGAFDSFLSFATVELRISCFSLAALYSAFLAQVAELDCRRDLLRVVGNFDVQDVG
jgi:hypothetical protein